MSGLIFTRDKILGFARKLPATPSVLGQLQRLLADANSGLEEISALLKRDMALAASVLRISNSAVYGSAAPHASLEEAVGCVGYNEVYKLVGLAISAQFFSKKLQYYGCTAEELWANTLCTALAMESLAQFAGVDPRSAYTAGLMRAMGKTVLDRLAAEVAPAPATFAASGQPTIGAWESQAFGCENTMVSGLLLKEWNLPKDIWDGVLRHYTPEDSSLGGAMGCLLNFACGVAQDLGYGLAGEEAYWLPNAVKWERAKLTEGDLHLCRDEVKVSFAKLQSAFTAANTVTA